MKRIFKKQRRVKIAIRKCPVITLIYKQKIMLFFKVILTSLIRTLFTDQNSSLGINRWIKEMILLDFLRQQDPMLTIQSPISIGESVKRLLAPHNTTTFFSDGGVTKFLTCQRKFSAWSPPIPKFNAFNDVNYLCHTFKYLADLL